MCLSRCDGKRLRRFDVFGSPVGVTYNSEYRHKTGLGGCISLAFAIFFGGSVLLSLIDVLINKHYTAKTQSDYS